MFADDINWTANGKSIDEIKLGLKEDLDNIRLQANKLSHNVAKTEYMRIGSRERSAKLFLEPNVYIGRDPIKKVTYTKYLKFTLMNLLHGASMLKK